MTETILQDRTRTGRIRPWVEHKSMNELLSHAYEDINENKAVRLRDCARMLSFSPPDESGHQRLRNGSFCRVRLCPMCTWRRSLKVAGQMRRVMDAIKADKPMAYIMLNLTVKNCFPEDLSQALDDMTTAFKRLMKIKTVTSAVKGYYRAIEVTHNLDADSKNYDTFHPHIHAVVAVNPSYFTSRDYIKQEKWTEMWAQSMRLDYQPVVDVRKIKGDTAKAVAEIAKYALKDNVYIIPDDWDMTVDTVRLLDAVLANRRFVGFGGIFKDYHKKLNLDDAEDGDLVHVGEDEPAADEGERLVHFAWFSGYRQYRQVEL